MPLPAAVARKVTAANEHIARASGAPATPAAVPAAGDGAAQLADIQEKLRKAEERFVALEGKYNAEIPRTAAELRKANAELKIATDRVKELEAALTKKIEAGELTSVTDADRQLLGKETIDATTRIAREVAQQTLTAGMAPFNQRVDMLERMSDDAYFFTLDEAVPSWERVNNEQKFIAWLNQRDPTTQRTRYDVLKRAEAARQGRAVAEVFLAYLEEREIGVPKAAAPASELDKRTDPPAGGGNDPTLGEERDAAGKRIWKRSEISLFYKEKATGKWRGREAEARVQEEDMFAAQKEGRVREG